MFEGTPEALPKKKQKLHNQQFLHSVILAKVLGETFKPDMAAGHSLESFRHWLLVVQ